MSRTDRNPAARRRSERGQTMLLVLLALGLFLLGALAFGVDIASLWFHRQTAQTAADAACTAGIMDTLYQAEGISTYSWIGSTTDCSGNSSGATAISPCWYAAKNGYSGADVSAGVPSVKLSYPAASSLSGLVPACGPSGPTGPVCVPGFVTHPLLQVNVNDSVRVFFAALLNGGKTTMNVGAKAVCGVLETQSPIPILVLDPSQPPGNGKKNGSALSVQGTPTIAVVGGPSQSIQVNSNQSNAVNIGGSATINLSQGGPNNTGSTLGSYGGPNTAPSGFIAGTTGGWVSPSTIISDPFAQLAAPAQPGNTETGPYATGVTGNGCPAGTSGGCDEYTPGYYPGGILVKNATAIFDPGIYYVGGSGFTAAANSCMRPSTATGSGIGGTMFYLAGSGTVSVASNSGSTCAASFDTSTGALGTGVKCTATSTIPNNLPTTLTGNVLLAPCTGTYGDPLEALGQTDPLGEQRGMLLFQDRSATLLNPSWGGGGTFLLAGTMYFHSCNASGTGTNCSLPPNYEEDVFTLQGNSGSGTYVLGDIVTDNLILGGTSAITMDLNPTSAYYILKATLLQ